MPILQNKLVIKSIEALHDEALALVPDTDGYRDSTAPTLTLHNKTPAKESPINKPLDTSTDASPETETNHNIMARIDHLLKKLDEDEDVAVAAPSDKEPKSSLKDQTSDAFDHTAEGKSDDMLLHGKKDEKPRPDQAQALADIAEAIYQAQHQVVNTVAADASQNNYTSFDLDALSATVADEVRRTVSAVMIAELPNLVRDAVGEEIRALPANALGQSKPIIRKPLAAKAVAKSKTASNRKSGSEKARTKKTVTKKPTNKTGTKKLGIKKLKPKKGGDKTTAKNTPSK